MDKKLKAKWIKALESKKYKKGVNRLCTQDGMWCCLGVLCDIADERPTEKKWQKYSSVFSVSCYTYGKPPAAEHGSPSNPENTACYIPVTKARKWLGSKHSTTQKQLSQINDMSKTFEPVVKWIKENL